MRVLACALAVLVAVSACAAAPPEKPGTRLRFAAGTPGGGFLPLGEGLAREYERVLPGLQIEVHESDGAASNVEAIQRGEADIGLSHADVTYLAYVGRLEGKSEPFRSLRGIAMLQSTRMHVVVRAGSGISRIEDLRGRRISIGRLGGGGGGTTARMILAAFGIELSSVTVESLRYDEAASRLSQRTLDALLVNGSCPLDAVTNAAQAGARILPLDGPPIDRLRQAYPFFSRAVIPPGTYPGQVQAVHTIGVGSLLVCRSDLDEALVHDLTQRLFEILPALSSQLALGPTDLEHAPATPIPLHDGAARYYRERELSR
jgi:TRAP transporter TAXI family solute receptor